MTSEVIVMNRWGVALAADSAVTINTTDDISKTRDSGLKLFMLSKYHPVGIMVYNNVSLLGVPWETIIKLFRQSLKDKCYNTLEKYGQELIRYLEKNLNLFPLEVQEKYYFQNLEHEFWQIHESAKETLSDIVMNKKLTDAKVRNLQSKTAKDVIKQELQSWKEKADCFDDKASNEFLVKLSGNVHNLINKVFKNWGLDSESVGHLWEFAKLLISKDSFLSTSDSGIVIAGFGEREHYPALQHIKIGGVYGNRLKYSTPTYEKITDTKPSIVQPFAHTDTVFNFLYGVTKEVLELLDEAKNLIQNMPVDAINVIEDLLPEQQETWKQKISVESKQLAQKFHEKIQLECGGRKHQILQEIETLPHKELAQVASTLVNLSSFQQRMSPEIETVGGPVDVAVISKGDGFIWIKRKHYFQKELNSHFFQTYFHT